MLGLFVLRGKFWLKYYISVTFVTLVTLEVAADVLNAVLQITALDYTVGGFYLVLHLLLGGFFLHAGEFETNAATWQRGNSGFLT